MHLIDHLLMFLLGVVLPLRSLQSARRGDLQQMTFNAATKRIMYYGNGGVLWILAIVALVVWWLSDRPLMALGLGWGELPYPFVAWAILIGFTALYSMDLFLELGTHRRRESTRKEMRKDLAFLPTSGSEFAHYLFLAFSAGICEEIVFRGYFIRYFQWLFGSEDMIAIAMTLVVPGFIFGVSHFYQGRQAVIKIVSMAIMFGAFFLVTGSIWPLMILHALVDVLGGVISWYVGEDEEEEVMN